MPTLWPRCSAASARLPPRLESRTKSCGRLGSGTPVRTREGAGARSLGADLRPRSQELAALDPVKKEMVAQFFGHCSWVLRADMFS